MLKPQKRFFRHCGFFLLLCHLFLFLIKNFDPLSKNIDLFLDIWYVVHK